MYEWSLACYALAAPQLLLGSFPLFSSFRDDRYNSNGGHEGGGGAVEAAEAVAHLAALVLSGHIVEHSGVINEGVQLPAGKEATLPTSKWKRVSWSGAEERRSSWRRRRDAGNTVTLQRCTGASQRRRHL